MPPLHILSFRWRTSFSRFLFQTTCGFFLLLCMGASAQSQAGVLPYRRVAVLIADDLGWPKNEAPLRYSVTGDLEPLRRLLIERMGFHPDDILVLLRPSKQAILDAITQSKQRLQGSTSSSFFLFYYTGHADENALHLRIGGKPNGKPDAFSYKTLKQHLKTFPAKLRWTVLDACRTGGFIDKGAGPTAPYKLLPPDLRHEEGQYIFTSGNHPTREFHSLKGSFMTHTILRGLSGEADHSKDGVITFPELLEHTKAHYRANKISHTAHFTSRTEISHTARFTSRTDNAVYQDFPLALIPAHRLIVMPHRVGDLQIHRQAQSPYTLRLSALKRRRALLLPSGHYRLRYRHEARCYEKTLALTKGTSATLVLEPPTRKAWQPCTPSTQPTPPTQPPPPRVAHTNKGSRAVQPFSLQPISDWSLPSTDPWIWTVEATVGGLGTREGQIWGGGSLLLGRRFFHLRLGFHGTRTDYAIPHTPDNISALHHESVFGISTQIEMGWMLEWHEMHFFLGATTGFLLLWHVADQVELGGVSLRLGGVLRFHKWWTAHWGIQISAWLGSHIAYESYAESPRWAARLAWEIGVGPAWRFD